MSRRLLKFSKRSLRVENLRSLGDLNKRLVGRRLLASLCKSSAKSRQMLVCLQSTEALGIDGSPCCFLLAVAAHRRAIEGERQYLTLRQTLRTVPMTFSMMLVQASERRSSRGRPSLVTVSISSIPSRIEAETPFQSGSRRRARLRVSVSAFSAPSIPPGLPRCVWAEMRWRWTLKVL